MNVDASEFDEVPEDELEYEPFRQETYLVKSFDCGVPELNDFLNTEEVEDYEREGFGKTILVYFRGALVGYLTTSTADLRVEKLKVTKGKVFFKSKELRLDAVPSIMIGRFAVDRRWRRKKVGKAMMRYIVGRAFALSEEYAACRLLILNTMPITETIDFYHRMGFQFTDDHAEKNKRNKTMFLDLHELRDVVGGGKESS